ncbi:hypothetical protein AX289_19115 [Methylorubrum populi]|nr:hypothetical protein AX289_19115 [Methylorubrum populi]
MRTRPPRRTPPAGHGDVLKRDQEGHPTQHAATISKTPNILSAIVSRAGAAGSLDTMPGFKNPFGKGIKLVADARAEEKRPPFCPTAAPSPRRPRCSTCRR